MPTTRLQKPKSPHGTSGPGETNTPISENEIIPESLILEDSSPAASAEAAVAAVDSGEPAAHRYSATDAKLATRMSKHIAKHLGLAGKSRSIRI